MRWMLDIQLGRRNLSPIQRIAVAEKYRPIYEKQAKENLKEGGRKGGLANSSKPSQNSSKASSIDNNIDVRAKLAKTAGVSTDTYSKGKKILDSDDEELKKRVQSGETSISAGYAELCSKGSAKKVGKRIKELERLYGIVHGGDRKSSSNNYNLKTQKQLAKEMCMSVDTLIMAKELSLMENSEIGCNFSA